MTPITSLISNISEVPGRVTLARDTLARESKTGPVYKQNYYMVTPRGGGGYSGFHRDSNPF